MKSQRIFATLAIGTLSIAGLSTAPAQTGAKPVVITPPAVQDGSNWSRAPLPAQRRFDDLKSPDGVAIDQTLPPNTPATNVEPPKEAPRVAILQPAAPAGTMVATTTTTPAPVAVATTTTEPVLTPTGRTNVMVASALDATNFAPTIRAATYANRDQVIADIESRINAANATLGTARSTASTMSADGRSAFATADKAVTQKAKDLKKSIQAARKAGASEWENARAQLAADFDAYASAVAQIDASAAGR